MLMEIQVLPWDRHKNVAGLNQLIVFGLAWGEARTHKSLV
jgi:hypothetical protein